MRILIADDHPVIREGLKNIIESHEAMTVVGEAKDADQALELASRLNWDVAVVDYSMPGRAGADLVKEIKRCHPGRPVLVLSVHPEEIQGVQVLKAGASGYLNKEGAAEELIIAIKKVASGGKYVGPKLAERLVDDLALNAERPVHEMLSDRECRVMPLLASGKKIKEISEELYLHPSTISTYRARILRKLGLERNSDLIRYAIKHRMIRDDAPYFTAAAAPSAGRVE